MPPAGTYLAGCIVGGPRHTVSSLQCVITGSGIIPHQGLHHNSHLASSAGAAGPGSRVAAWLGCWCGGVAVGVVAGVVAGVGVVASACAVGTLEGADPQAALQPQQQRGNRCCLMSSRVVLVVRPCSCGVIHCNTTTVYNTLQVADCRHMYACTGCSQGQLTSEDGAQVLMLVQL